MEDELVVAADIVTSEGRVARGRIMGGRVQEFDDGRLVFASEYWPPHLACALHCGINLLLREQIQGRRAGRCWDHLSHWRRRKRCRVRRRRACALHAVPVPLPLRHCNRWQVRTAGRGAPSVTRHSRAGWWWRTCRASASSAAARCSETCTSHSGFTWLQHPGRVRACLPRSRLRREKWLRSTTVALLLLHELDAVFC